MNYPKALKNLIDCFKKLPGIGEKSAERMALSILNMDQELLDFFAESVGDVKKKLKRCKICNNFAEQETCSICADTSRDNDILCVVEEPKNILLLEKVGSFTGKYHVLGGLISPLEGIKPEELKIDMLIERIKKENIKEVILAIKTSIEGETTALYICKLLENTGVLVTKIAHGVPMGADMDYIDSLTLELALEDRKKIS